MRFYFITLLLIGCLSVVQSQEESIILVDILVEGNGRTRKGVVLRELPFVVGDTIALTELPDRLREAELQLMNTGLFTNVEISYADWKGMTNEVSLRVTVAEDWYLYPVPTFELADRNFNVWWTEMNRALNRINVGGEFTHQNFTGRADRFKIGAEWGYTRTFSVAYDLPYMGGSDNWGISFDASFKQNREVNYMTQLNKHRFFNDPSFIYQEYYSGMELSFRPKLYTRHNWLLGYQRNTVDESIIERNADFFGFGQSKQRFFSLSYRLVTDRRDIRAYPWQGNYVSFEVEKDGLGIYDDRNTLTVQSNYRHYFPIGKAQRLSFGFVASGKLSLIRGNQAYNYNRALGYGVNSLRGYEFYVVDGLDLALLKTSLRVRLFDQSINFGKLVPIRAFRQMPIKTYFGVYGDTGFAHDPFFGAENPLNDRLLYGGGAGFDIVIYYDKVIRLQYNLNHLRETGFFLKLDLNI